MDFLLEALTNWLKEMLVGGIMSNLSGMFDSVNQQVADISVQVGQTPQGWNGSIFSMIENLSNSIMVPIAGVILAIVMTVDLIQMIADKNNLHDVDTWMIFKWVFKSAAAILIVTNTWNIVMGVFDMAQSVVAQAAGIINSDASIDISSVMTDLEPRLMEMDLGPLFGLWFQSLFIGITMWALYICIFIVIYKKRLAQAERRLGELDRLFIRIYEDNVAGKLSDERFALMSKTYEDEQMQLKAEIQTLQQEIEVQERQIENLEQFIQRVHKYEDLQEMTPYALRELVKGIYIEAPDKSSGKRRQGIRISYDLVGFIPVDELMKQETA